MTEFCRYQLTSATASVHYSKENRLYVKLKGGLFTTGCVDNIDHNPSSRTATDSFHGTAISLAQHPSSELLGRDRGIVIFNPNTDKSKRIAELPGIYTYIQPITIQTKDPVVPEHMPQ